MIRHASTCPALLPSSYLSARLATITLAPVAMAADAEDSPTGTAVTYSEDDLSHDIRLSPINLTGDDTMMRASGADDDANGLSIDNPASGQKTTFSDGRRQLLSKAASALGADELFHEVWLARDQNSELWVLVAELKDEVAARGTRVLAPRSTNGAVVPPGPTAQRPPFPLMFRSS